MPSSECGFGGDAEALASSGPRLNVIVVALAAGMTVRDTRFVSALIDTGATSSVIDERLAQELGLPRIGFHSFYGVSGLDTRPTYLTTILATSLQYTVHEPMGGVDLSGGNYQVLLGRDFLKHFTMFYDGRTGMVVVSNDLSPNAAQHLAQAISAISQVEPSAPS